MGKTMCLSDEELCDLMCGEPEDYIVEIRTSLDFRRILINGKTFDWDGEITIGNHIKTDEYTLTRKNLIHYCKFIADSYEIKGKTLFFK